MNSSHALPSSLARYNDRYGLKLFAAHTAIPVYCMYPRYFMHVYTYDYKTYVLYLSLSLLEKHLNPVCYD